MAVTAPITAAPTPAAPTTAAPTRGVPLLTVDEGHLGTTEAVWRRSGRTEATAPLVFAPKRRVVIVAPHPDDEVLGAGGLIRRLAGTGSAVEVVAVTDGEASHPGSPAAAGIDLRARRAGERAEALRRLSPDGVGVVRLGLPDGAVAHHEEELRTALAALLGPDDLCVAPWLHDGHPDHDAAGRAALDAATARGCDVLGYLVWAWHWATPDGDDLPWASCRRLTLTRRESAHKRWASSAFTSQLRPLGPHPDDGPILPDAVARRSWRRHETFVVGRPS